jgi:hypothetical protein
MKRRRLSDLLLVCLVCLIFAPVLMAQTAGTGALSGTVTDTSGAVVPDATVMATSNGNGQVRTTKTNVDGKYQIGLLPPGDYKVKIEKVGFRSEEVSSVTVTVTESYVLNRVLQVGAQTQEVNVVANVEQLQVSSATEGATVLGQTLTDLPLVGRNFQNLLSLAAGASANVSNAAAVGRGTQEIYVNGGTSSQNNYQIDGASVVNFQSVETTESGGIGAIPIPNPDSLQEFKIQTSQFDAGSGRNSGANVNVVTKSGTSAFHGDLFEFFRDTALNANDFFVKYQESENAATPGKVPGLPATNTRLPLNQNQYGGTLGGPVKKNKLFFFASYQQTNQTTGVPSPFGFNFAPNVKLPILPSGNRGSATVESSSTPWLSALYADYCGKTGVTAIGVQIRAPQFGPSAGTCANAGYNPAVATANINPIALDFLQLQFPNGNYYVPSGSAGTGGVGLATEGQYSPSTYNEHQGVGNFDYIINSKNTLTERFFMATDPSVHTFPSFSTTNQLLGSAITQRDTYTDALMKLTTVLSSNWVNEARISYQRIAVVTTNDIPFTSNAALPASSTNVPINVLVPSYTKLADINVLGNDGLSTFSSGASATSDTYSNTDEGEIADQVSWNHGKHTFRFGFELAHYLTDPAFPNTPVDTLSFGSFPDLLLGLSGCAAGTYPTTCSPTNPGTTNGTPGSNFANTGNPSGSIYIIRYVPVAMNSASAYAQDDFKVTPSLMVNLGVRWEFDGLTHSPSGLASNVWPSLAGRLAPVVSAACPLPTVSIPALPTTTCGNYQGLVVPSNYPYAVPSGVYTSAGQYITQTNAPHDNFAPRLGLAWKPPIRGEKLVVRAGAGLFYDQPQDFFMAMTGAPLTSVSGNAGLAANAPGPNFANPFVAGLVGSNNFRSRYVVPGAGVNPQTGTSSNLAGSNMDPNWVTPVTYTYTLNVQYEIAPAWVLEVGYVGTHGIHQIENGYSWNVPSLAIPAVNNLGLPANPVNCGWDGVATDCITTNSTSNTSVRAPYLGYGTGDSFSGGYNATKYNALQTTLRKQMTHGLEIQAAYTWSKTLSTGNSSQGGTQYGNPNVLLDPSQPVITSYAEAGGYHPQRLSLNYVWSLPFPKRQGFLGKVTSGWMFSGETVIQDGTPLAVIDPTAGTAFGHAGLAQFAPGFNNSNIQSTGSMFNRVINGYFNEAGFAPVPTVLSTLGANAVLSGNGGTLYGNTTQGIALGPGQDNWDMALSKTTRVGGLREGATLQFRAEFFNAFNHPQFNPPNTTSTSAGAITATGVGLGAAVGGWSKITSTSVNPRLIQFALKYVF